MARKGRKNSMENYKMVKLLAFCVWKSSFFLLLQIVMISEITIKNCFMLLVVHLNPIIYETFQYIWQVGICMGIVKVYEGLSGD
jgi:hypothetical protein